MGDGLFEALAEQLAPQKARAKGAARLREPVRDRLELRATTLDSLIGQDHPARLFWDYVVSLDLGPLEDGVKSREAAPGRPAASRRLLLALWLFATSEGVGSARALADLCESHDAYRWLAGGVSLNHHTLSDFRVAHGEFLDGLLSESVAALCEAGVIDLDRLSHDGVRIRASAGAASFRRRSTLETHLAQARELVEPLKAEVDAHPRASRDRTQAARERTARQRQQRLETALEKHAQIEAAKEKEKEKERVDGPPEAASEAKPEAKPKIEKEPRVSTTDPQARVMKMADGGFRPAVNGQVTTVTGTNIIVGIDVSDNGSDRGLLMPALDQAQRRYGAQPSAFLADGGFTSNEAIEQAAERGTAVYCPPTRNKYGTDPFKPRRRDGPGVLSWRERMASEAGKAIYSLRAITECAHAHMRQNGLLQLTVRGLAKAKSVLVMHALANNILQGRRLMSEAGWSFAR